MVLEGNARLVQGPVGNKYWIYGSVDLWLVKAGYKPVLSPIVCPMTKTLVGYVNGDFSHRTILCPFSAPNH